MRPALKEMSISLSLLPSVSDGKRVVALHGMAINDAVRRFLAVIPGDNVTGQKSNLEIALRYPGLHYGIGLAKKKYSGSLTVMDASGSRKTIALVEPTAAASVTFSAGPPHSLVPKGWVSAAPAQSSPPLWQRNLNSNYFTCLT